MAIKRCPYCRAIINESDQYCKSCGTQLLFPDEDAVEEEIPGDRIVDEPEEGGESGEEAEAAAADAVDEPAAEEEAEAPPAEAEAAADHAEEAVEPAFIEDVIGEHARAAETILKSLDDLRPRASKTAPSEELKFETAEGPSPAKTDGHLTFRTKEIDRFMPTAELGKSQFEDFLASFKEDKGDTGEAAEAQAAKEPPPQTPAEGVIPPWAERIQAAAGEETTEPEAAAEARPTSPSGIGLPETLTLTKTQTQTPLPFGEEERPMPLEEESEEQREDERLEPEAAEEEERPEAYAPAAEPWPAEDRARIRRPPSRFKTKLKAMLFDLGFIGAFWAVALWLASRSMEVSLFRLVGEAALPVGLFYLILLAAYWALFYFFLGETFGDRLFALSEE